MPPSRHYDHALTVRESFGNLTLDDLRPLSELLGRDPPKKKTDLVPLFGKEMTNPARVRALYEKLDDLSRNAVRLATHDPKGHLDLARFVAHYGTAPRFDTADPDRRYWEYSYQDRKAIKPTLLRLFFPKHKWLPTDLRELLLSFVPPPEAFKLPTLDALPTEVTRTEEVFSGLGKRTREEWQEPVRVRETALDAEADVRAVLRLIDAGKVRVTDKKRTPTEAARKTVAGVLSGGDFYTAEDAVEDGLPSDNLDIKPFAWPMLVRVGELAEKRGDALKLTTAGKAALAAPASETIRKLWRAWLKTRDHDEFARVEEIKGQNKGGLGAPAARRAKIVEALKECPPGRWFLIDEFFKFMIATDRNFVLCSNEFEMYIADTYYGHLGNCTWQQLEGRFVLAFLFEYAATLGLIDVAFIHPTNARSDFGDLWGTDDIAFLSRYDGLMFIRINPLGAWCLGQTATYTAPTRPKLNDLRVLSNFDVVAEGALAAADRLTLEKFAAKTSDRVWHLAPEKLIAAIENGSTLAELREFLATHTADEIPATVATLLADAEHRATRFTDNGAARLIACADPILAVEVMADPKLKGKCLLAGDRVLVIREADLSTAKTVFRKLGHVWPLRAE